MSALNVPYLQLSFVVMFSIFKLTALASSSCIYFLCRIGDIVKGPKLLLASVSLGKSFKFNCYFSITSKSSKVWYKSSYLHKKFTCSNYSSLLGLQLQNHHFQYYLLLQFVFHLNLLDCYLFHVHTK